MREKSRSMAAAAKGCGRQAPVRCFLVGLPVPLDRRSLSEAGCRPSGVLLVCVWVTGGLCQAGVLHGWIIPLAFPP